MTIKQEVPMYMVFVLYLIISSNFLAELFPCKLQKLLNNSMVAKHFIGFMTLLFFVVLASGDEHGATEALTSSIIIYLLFMVSTRMSFMYFGIFMFLSAVLYILHLYQKENQHNQQIMTAQKIIQYIMVAILVVGFIFYMVEKKREYKNKFSMMVFLVGKPVCRGKSPETTNTDIFNFLRNSVSIKKKNK